MRINSFCSESLGSVVLSSQIPQMDSMRTAALEEEINQRIQQLKATAIRAESHGSSADLELIQAERAVLTAWHQRLLTRRQQLRDQRHRVFSESFVQIAKEHLDPQLLKQLIAATQERLSMDAAATSPGRLAALSSERFDPRKCPPVLRDSDANEPQETPPPTRPQWRKAHSHKQARPNTAPR